MKLTSQEIYTRFRQRALRVTRQRAAIYAALTGTASHPTADELYRTVRRQYPMMSLNTIYYTLGVLRQAGLVREVNVGHDVARFDGNVTAHHHLICLGCRTRWRAPRPPTRKCFTLIVQHLPVPVDTQEGLQKTSQPPLH